MADNLSVKVTADVTELQTKLAIAQSELRAFSADTRSLADEMRTAGAAQKAELAPALAAAATGAAAARAQISSLNSELGHGHGSISTATREFRALFDELSSGRTRQTPGTLAIIGQRVFGLGPAALGALGGVAALAGGLAYLAVQSVRAAAATEAAAAQFAFRGLDESRQQVEAWVKQVAGMPGVSEEAAGKTVAAFSHIRDATPQLVTALIDRLPALAKGLGEDVPAAANKLADVFADLEKKGEPFLRTLGASPATINQFVQAASQGNRAQEMAIVLAQIEQEAEKVDATLRQSTVTTQSFWERMTIGAMASAGAIAEAGQMLKDLDDSKVKKIADDLKAASQAPSLTPQVARPDSTFEQELADIKSRTDLSNQQIIADEIAAYDRRIAELGKFGIDFAAVDKQRTNLVREQVAAAGTEAIAQAHNQVAAISGATDQGAVQRLDQERQVWQQLLDGDKLTANQRLEVQHSLNDSIAALNRGRQEQDQAIARSDVDTNIAISRQRLEAQKNLLGEEFAAKKITAQQEFDTLRDIARQEEQLDEQRLQDELATLQNDPVKYEQVYNQIRELRARLDTDLSSYNKQEELDTERSTKQQVSAWKGAADEITSSEDSLVRNVLTKRYTLTQDLEQLSGQLIEKELSDDLRYYTTKLLYNALGLASDKVTAQGGVLVHLLGESQKTAATETGVATRNAATATENTSLLGDIGRSLASWLGLETSKTAATTAGVATRTTEDTAGAAAGAVAAHAAGEAYAGEAAAAAMASVAAIPVTGWAMAPGVGSTTFAEASGFASAAGGMLEVPSDNYMIAAHAGESVLPANVADPMRNFFSGGGPGGGGDSYTINVNAIDGQSAAQFLKNNAGTIVNALQLQKRLGNSAFSTAPT